MNTAAAHLLSAVALSWCGLSLVQAQTRPQELHPALSAAGLSGQATMTFLGFQIYQAKLWVTSDFVASGYEQGAFALELSYLRDFKGVDIAKRSIAEMRRQADMSLAQEADWLLQMEALFPNVKAGDRITGVNQPNIGAAFWFNGHRLGEVRDPAFAKRFFGIWLAPHTSQPQLRRALLTHTPPSTTPTGTTP
jgi:Chalcone isomerase-like